MLFHGELRPHRRPPVAPHEPRGRNWIADHASLLIAVILLPFLALVLFYCATAKTP